MVEIDEFTESYIEAALWSSNDQSTEQGGEPMDEYYGPDDIAPETLAKMVSDCREFQEQNADDIATWFGGRSTGDEQAGHDFWLTRNGHGAGFNDGDWGDGMEDRLSESAQSFGEFDLYVGDDGKIHGSPL